MDKEFLKKLFAQQQQQKFARLTKLTWDEQAIEAIEGRITSGTINIDGNSGLRRTCNLSMVMPELDINDFTIALRTKVKVEVGIANTIDQQRPPIIWFKQGIFIATGFNTSISASNATINFSGKDKSCLLNGEISGSFPAQTDVGAEEWEDVTYEPVTDLSDYEPGKYYYSSGLYGNQTYILDYSYKPRYGRSYFKANQEHILKKIPIEQIIRNIVHVFGNEPLENIIINDLALYGLELLEYRGAEPGYLFLIQGNSQYSQIILDGSYTVTTVYNGAQIKLEDLMADRKFFSGVQEVNGDEIFNVRRIDLGDMIGYHATDLVYTGDLIANAGETVMSVLDKIKNMLVNFEYFYDVDGHFIFQAKHDYTAVNFTAFSTDGNNDLYIEPSAYKSSSIWNFDETTQVNVSHTPNLTNLRNDYSIHGMRKSADGRETPIHLRYALETKPVRYTTLNITDSPRANITYEYDPSKAPGDLATRLRASYLKYLTNIEKYQKKLDSDLNARTQDSNDCAYELQMRSKQIINDLLKGVTDCFAYLEGENYQIVQDKYHHSTFWYRDFKNGYKQLIEKLQNDLITIQTKMIGYLKQKQYVSDSLQDNYDNYKNLINSLWQLGRGDNENYWNYIFQEQLSGPRDEDFYMAYQAITKSLQETLEQLILSYNIALTSFQWNKAINYAIARCYAQILLLYWDTFLQIVKKEEGEEGASTAPTVVYEKIGAAYNYGDANWLVDYTAMVQKNFVGTITYKSKYNNLERDEYQVQKTYNDVYCLKLLVLPEFWQCTRWYGQLFYRPAGERIYDNTSYVAALGYNKNKNSSNGVNVAVYTRLTQLYTETGIDSFAFAWESYNMSLSLNKQLYSGDYNNILRSAKDEVIYVDWREIIYQMAKDYYDYAHNPDIDYPQKLKEANPQYDRGKTGYEVFYTDILSFWRELYFNPLHESFNYQLPFGYKASEYNANGWHKTVTDGGQINFWFDLCDNSYIFADYSISAIGDRLKVINNNNITSILFEDVPNILYFRPDEDPAESKVENDNEYTYTNMLLGKTLDDLIVLSGQHQTAMDALQDNLYKYLYCTEAVNITTLPIYTLEPNYRVSITSGTPGLSGEYIVSRITIPLTFNGMMQLTCTKAIPYLGRQS